MMTLRRWHRWSAIPAGIFMIVITLTGLLLHLDMIRLGQNPPGHDAARPETLHPIPSDADLALMTARIAAAARAERSMTVKVIQINLAGPRVTLSAGSGGPPGSPQIVVDGQSGQRIVTPPPPRDFHYILQDIHAGYFLGWPGRILSMACGVALLILSITGLQVWWDMRRRGKKKGFYWK